MGAQRAVRHLGGRSPPPFLFLVLGLSCPAYPADEGGIGERGSHVVELEVIHVVEELCGGGESQAPSGTPHALSHPPRSMETMTICLALGITCISYSLHHSHQNRAYFPLRFTRREMSLG